MTIQLTIANFAVEPLPPNGIVAPLQDNDIIVLEPYDRADPNTVGLRLRTAPGMWFKGIEFWGGGQVTKLEVGNGGALTPEAAIPAAWLEDSRLVFVKAKVFGAHTPMYELAASELAKYVGRGILFDWRRDG